MCKIKKIMIKQFLLIHNTRLDFIKYWIINIMSFQNYMRMRDYDKIIFIYLFYFICKYLFFHLHER